MSHMSAIGFGIPQEEFTQRMALAAPESGRTDTPFGAYLQWQVGSGVEIWMQANAVNQNVGCNPHFSGLGRHDGASIETVRATGTPVEGPWLGGGQGERTGCGGPGAARGTGSGVWLQIIGSACYAARETMAAMAM